MVSSFDSQTFIRANFGTMLPSLAGRFCRLDGAFLRATSNTLRHRATPGMTGASATARLSEA